MMGRGENRLVVNRLVLLAAVPLFLVLAVVAYITIQFAANERAGPGLGAPHLSGDAAQLGRILDDARTAETGQRGYLLTGDPALPGALPARARRRSRPIWPPSATSPRDNPASRPAPRSWKS